MPAPTVKPTATAVRWPIPAALAIAPLVLGLLVSFSSDHSAPYGFGVLSIFSLVTAVASVVAIVLLPSSTARIGAILKVAVGVVGAAFAAFWWFGASGTGAGASTDAASQVAVLQWTAFAVLALLAAIDLVVGVRARTADRFGRDWITLGVLEALTAVAVVLVPSGYALQYTVTDKELPPAHLTLDAAIMVVGLLGAALAVIGVYLAIAAVSLMGRRQQVTA